MAVRNPEIAILVVTPRERDFKAVKRRDVLDDWNIYFGEEAVHFPRAEKRSRLVKANQITAPLRKVGLKSQSLLLVHSADCKCERAGGQVEQFAPASKVHAPEGLGCQREQRFGDLLQD